MPTADRSKWVPRSFRSIEELRTELDLIESSHADGSLTTHGGWTVGQNLAHCANFWKRSFDGFDMKAPLPIRLVAMIFLKPMLTKPNSQMKPGIKLPSKARELLPPDEVSVEDGIAMMRTQIARVESGEQMTQKSPIFGTLGHDTWLLVHLNHCRMHWGYFRFGDEQKAE